MLVHEGDPGAEMYFVRRGAIVIAKGITGGVEQVLARVGVGDFVGEMSLFDRRPRSATLRAESNTELLVLDRAAVHALVTTSPGAAAAFLRALSEDFIARLRRSNDLVAELTCAALEAAGFQLDPLPR